MKKIIVSAPGKLMLMGEFAVLENRPCIVTSVSRRMYVEVEILERDEFRLDAADVHVHRYVKSMSDLGKSEIARGARFVEIAVKNFLEKFLGLQAKSTPGVAITTKSEFSSRVGFGSSSASTVCVIKGLSELFGLHLSNRDIFDLAYKTVSDVQGTGSGFDVAAAVYGGTLYFVTGGSIIEQMEVETMPLVVGYSGVKADTVQLIKQVKQKKTLEGDVVKDIYNKIENLVEKSKDVFAVKDWQILGELMNNNQKYLEELGVSNTKLDKMIDKALIAGAYGAKLSGAGGGDCMVALVPQNKRGDVMNAIVKAEGQIIDIKTGEEGVRVEE